MTVESIDITKTIKAARAAMKGASPELRGAIELLITVITILVNRFNLNSGNSSKPPSTDRDKPKKKSRSKSKRKTGGQKGHVGTRLEPVDEPDEVVNLSIDRRTIPIGNYRTVSPVKRQVIDVVIARHVTEYQAEVLVDGDGNQFVAEFPEGVNQSVQYGGSVKAQVVYKSQAQLIPTDRVVKDLADNADIPLSAGSVHNFINEAYIALEEFEAVAKAELISTSVVHADETGVNVGGKNHWLHNVSNDDWTLYSVHPKRGTEAMDDMGIIPNFRGILCHDHWTPYLTYENCDHSLCNAHHLRELQRAVDEDESKWAKKMQDLLTAMNKVKEENGGVLPVEYGKDFVAKYRAILRRGDGETPKPPPKKKGQRGRAKKSKTRNLLERLQNFEEETLRFLDDPDVPFTNNQAERDIRMTKVQQKISGCFRSLDGARKFARIRSFISTCNKRGISSAKALHELFRGRLPAFVNDAKSRNHAE